MENTIFYFRKYENGISQIQKWTGKCRKRNGTVWENFRPFSSLSGSANLEFVKCFFYVEGRTLLVFNIEKRVQYKNK
jgi:hypothetical protein